MTKKLDHAGLERTIDGLLKHQQLIIDYDDETIQCMQSQIIGEIIEK